MKVLAIASSCAAAVCLAASAGAGAQEYPSKNIRIVVPWAPGGTTDRMARMIADHLRATLGASAIVDNRPGANGTIGTDLVARATPDGYTLLMATSSTHVVSPNLMKVPFDPVRDFASITLVGSTPFLLLVNPTMRAGSVSELVSLARGTPGKLNFGSYGQGSAPHLVAELFKASTGIDMAHVPYKGSAPVIQALLSNEVSIAFDPISSSFPQVKAGKLRALAATGSVRSALLPELPTMSEAGVAGFEANAWYGLQAPRKTPTAVIDKLYGEAAGYLKLPDTRKRFLEMGVTPGGTRPADFDAQIARESAKWRDVVKRAGIKIN